MPRNVVWVGLSLLWALVPVMALGQSALDRELKQLQERFQLEPLPLLPDVSQQPLYALGQALFFDKAISGNRNIACASCHQPGLGTSDGLPLSLGQGNEFEEGVEPVHSDGAVLRRSSPSLYNLGYDAPANMFWDNRVRYDAARQQFTTPSAYLNGAKPRLHQVVAELPNALAAQVMFPMVDRLEMRGLPGENEIADAMDERAAWRAITDRILADVAYQGLLAAAYPEVQLPEDVHIGHLAKALGYFIEAAFATPNTPYDAFLRGDLDQMSQKEKKGMVVFFSSGGCFRCHNGPLLARDVSANIGIPVIKPSPDAKPDLGQYELTQDPMDRYAFKTPALRNVALSAPYMHNGAYATLEAVVEHYSNPRKSVKHYALPEAYEEGGRGAAVYYDAKASAEASVKVDIRLEMGMLLSREDKANLVAFLKHSLTDPGASQLGH